MLEWNVVQTPVHTAMFGGGLRPSDALRKSIVFRHIAGLPPSLRLGRRDVAATIVSHLRKTSLVPVISDFLFANAAAVIKELSILNGAHDVFLMLVDARFAYQLPSVSAGWIQMFDVETGRTRTVSRREFARLAQRVGEWQDEIFKIARDADLDIVRVGLDRWAMETVLVEFVADTGFEGDLALPGHIARQLGNRRSGLRARALAV